MLTGSITLAHLVIAEGMVDEYRMFVYPAVQGRGRRFFPKASVDASSWSIPAASTAGSAC